MLDYRFIRAPGVELSNPDFPPKHVCSTHRGRVKKINATSCPRGFEFQRVTDSPLKQTYGNPDLPPLFCGLFLGVKGWNVHRAPRPNVQYILRLYSPASVEDSSISAREGELLTFWSLVELKSRNLHALHPSVASMGNGRRREHQGNTNGLNEKEWSQLPIQMPGVELGPPTYIYLSLSRTKEGGCAPRTTPEFPMTVIGCTAMCPKNSSPWPLGI
ncbi:hypothetical protein B0H16DRAFT_1448116 [Mycena metata]|uniref:Uncharacterized protein n=1 Tax=Mycena metata TaxID=1033252 RepID=A0AAD7NXT4_9AGAR|nr:hypothetical protein B0H16DRAFT_1448116 [Mycena metata]